MLTENALRKLKPKATLYRKSDRNGLCLEIHPDGKKTWRYRYRFARKATMATYGNYPDVSLAEARTAHAADVKMLRSGKNPNTERKAEKLRRQIANSNTFQGIAEDWLKRKQPEWTEKNEIKERGRLVNHVFPFIGKLPIADVGVVHVGKVLDTIIKHGTVDTAHRVRQTMSCVFRFAVAHELASNDPAHALKDHLPAHRKQQYSHVTDSNLLGDLLRAIHGFTGQFPTACALKLAPMLLLRPGELRQGEWSEIDLDAAMWTIPAWRMKLKKAIKLDPKAPPHLVPLSTQVVSILRELHQFTGDGKFLFPGARDRKRPMSNATLNAALKRMGFDSDVIQPHGFRHTASTALNEMGRFLPQAIEEQLAHKKRGIEGVYNKAKYLPARKEIMQSWADYLDDLRLGRPIGQPDGTANDAIATIVAATNS